MARSLKIRYATSHYVAGRHDGVRIRIEVVCANEVCPAVFAYRTLPKDPHGNNEAHFSHVASPVDIEEWPREGPCPGSSPEWFRLSFVDVLVRSVHEAHNFLEAVRCYLKRLLDTYCKMDEFMFSSDHLFACGGGVDCDPVSSSSLSLPSSSSSSGSSLAQFCFAAVNTNELQSGFGVPWMQEPDVGALTGVDYIFSSSSSSSSLSSSSVSLVTCVELNTGEASQMLLSNGFDFSSLPDGATVVGVTARITLRNVLATGLDSSASSISLGSACVGPPFQFDGCPRLSLVSLQHPNLGLGDNKATMDCIDGPEYNTVVYGGQNDVWGHASLTTDDVKDGAFGLGLVVDNDFDVLQSKVCVDRVVLEVCYLD